MGTESCRVLECGEGGEGWALLVGSEIPEMRVGGANAKAFLAH